MGRVVMVLASIWAILGTPLMCPGGLVPCCAPTDACSSELSHCDDECTDIVPSASCACPCSAPTPIDECPTCVVTCAPLTLLDAGPQRPILDPACWTAAAPMTTSAFNPDTTFLSVVDDFSSGRPLDGPTRGALPLLI